jgi:hypothetical protein
MRAIAGSLLFLLIVVGSAVPFSPLAEAQSNCVTLINDHTFANGCNRAVSVRWSDQGFCQNGSCGDSIAPESYTQITTIRGHVCWTVAWYPNNPPYPRC